MRYYYNSKTTVEESCRLKMSYLRKRGMLTGEEAFEKISWTSNRPGKIPPVLLLVDVTTDDPFAILAYSITDREGNKTDYKREVSLVTTPCNFGGIRYWFACPVCFKRVGGLYLPPGDIYFCCRGCHNLSYNSRNEPHCVRRGGLYYPLKLDGQIDKLYSQIKRWTWRGRPTRKVRKLRALERKWVC